MTVNVLGYGYRVGQSATASNNFDIEPDGAGGLLITNVGTGKQTQILPSGAIKDPRVMVDVTASRALSTPYTNNTDYPIEVMVGTNNQTVSGHGMYGALAGVGPVAFGRSGGGGTTAGIQLTVPAHATYNVTTDSGTIAFWFELRMPA